MVLMCQPLLDALESVRTKDSTVILLSPQGTTFRQETARELALKDHLIFICGHYEGFDERIRRHADIQLSLGDFVLTGGEPAAQVMCDAILRLLPFGMNPVEVIPSPMACLNIRSTPGPMTIRGRLCRIFCCRGIMRTSGGGDARSLCVGPAACGRISWKQQIFRKAT